MVEIEWKSRDIQFKARTMVRQLHGLLRSNGSLRDIRSLAVEDSLTMKRFEWNDSRHSIQSSYNGKTAYHGTRSNGRLETFNSKLYQGKTAPW